MNSFPKFVSPVEEWHPPGTIAKLEARLAEFEAREPGRQKLALAVIQCQCALAVFADNLDDLRRALS